MISIPKHIQNLIPYAPGKPIEELKREKGFSRIVKLASNENPLGPSPKALEAIHACLSNSHYYPDANAYELVKAISQKFQKKPEEIICTHGIDSLLGYVIQAFSKKEDEILTFQGTFIGLYTNAKKFGRTLKLLPLTNYTFDLELLLKNIRPKTKLIYLANPNNPTGTMFDRHEFENFISRVPDHVLVILDEAYFSFSSQHIDFPDGLQYKFDNLIVARTLSKDYGLAGLRIGFGIGPQKLISELYKVKPPFEPNRIAQFAAIAALTDTHYLENSIKLSQRSLQHMTSTFQKLKLRIVLPCANFIMMVMPSEAFAKAFYHNCLSKGLILRHVSPFGIPEGIRINSATLEDTTFALDVIQRVYGELNEACFFSK